MSGQGQFDHRLDATTIHGRLQHNIYNLYLNYAFFIKGGVVATAGVMLYLIVASPDVSDRADRVFLWLASFAFSCAMGSTWTRIAIFTNWRSNGWDYVFPVGVGVLEVFMYVVLSPNVLQTQKEAPGRWIDWYLVFSLFAFAAAALVFNRWVQSDEEDIAVNPEMTKLQVHFRRWIVRDMVFLAAFAVASLVFYLWASHNIAQSAPFHIPAALVLGFVGGLMVYFSSTQFQRFPWN
jgi:hypothetical protein